MKAEHKRVVEAGYDRMAESYLATKDPEDPLALVALDELTRGLPPGAAVLDPGCGAGIPATRWLAHNGISVTGVDFSAKQLELARRLVAGAEAPVRHVRLYEGGRGYVATGTLVLQRRAADAGDREPMLRGAAGDGLASHTAASLPRRRSPRWPHTSPPTSRGP